MAADPQLREVDDFTMEALDQREPAGRDELRELAATLELAPRPEVSVVIPAFNEASRLPASLHAIGAELEQLGIRYEVVVADDGSSDRTRELAITIPTTSHVARLPHRGKGAAVRSGILTTLGDYILLCDADLSTPISEYLLLKRKLEETGADIAVGSRRLEDSELLLPQPFKRRLMGRVFNLLVRVLVLPGIKDTQCGFKLFRRRAALAVFTRCRVDGFAFDVEALSVARRLRLRIVEVPVRWHDSRDSRVSPLRDALRMLRELVLISLR